jgi:peptidoglycan hydrolase-like protein with peptidoglycan-binding domain
VQRELRKQGYDPGTIDGKMGPRTRSTLKRYQTDQGLLATGEIDAKTLETMELRTR